ncbi:efflux RND transporter permease subunit [Planctomycetota bacterium]
MFRRLIGFSVSNRVFANLLMLGVLALGIYSYVHIRLSMYPDVDHTWINIFTSYPGGQPEVIEREVTDPIEDEISKIDEIDLTLSETPENQSRIFVRLKMDVKDIDSISQKIRRRVNNVKLPERAEKPYVRTVSYSVVPVALIGLYGGSRYDLTKAADLLEEELNITDGIGNIELTGKAELEIHVAADPVRLAGKGMTMDDVSRTIRLRNTDIPGGSIEEAGEKYSIRLKGTYESIRDIKETIITSVKGTGVNQVKISDIADVEEVLDKDDVITEVNGKPAVILKLFKSKKIDSVKLMERVEQSLERVKRVMPEQVNAVIFNNSSKDIQGILKVLESSSILGLILVLVTLGLIIGWRQAVFAGLGIPVSFGVVIAYLYFTGFSLNQVTLFGMIIALGMIVDDSIVVIENVYRKMEKGITAEQAALEGTVEIAGPVFASSLTTICAFLPILLLGGPIGKVIRFIPVVVTVILIASLIECFLVLPSHLADWGKTAHHSVQIGKKLRKIIVRIARKVIRHGGKAVAGISLLMVLALVYLGLHGRELFSNEDLRSFRVGLEAPPGTDLDRTLRVVNKCASGIKGKYGDDCHVVVSFAGILEEDIWGTLVRKDTNVGQILVEIKEDAPYGISWYINHIKEDVKTIPDLHKEAKFIKLENAPFMGKDINVEIRGDDFSRIREVVSHFKSILKSIPGVEEIEDDYRLGKKQLRIQVNEKRAAEYGLSHTAVGFEVYRAFDGENVGVVHGDREDSDIVLLLKDRVRDSISDLKSLSIPTPLGTTVKLREIAEIKESRGQAVISHKSSRRAITVRAKVNSELNSSDKVNRYLSGLFPMLEKRFAGCTVRHTGEFEDLEESFRDLTWALLLALFLVYFILGTQFKSFLQPFLIMIVIPFSLIGVAASMIIGNNPLSIMIFVGIIGLIGVVVNDSLILIDYFNRLKKAGHSSAYVLLKGVATRARPVIFTSVTTIAGLLPAALGLTGKSLVWQPLAQTFIGGLIVSTCSTLFVVPILYQWLTNISGRGRKKK